MCTQIGVVSSGKADTDGLVSCLFRSVEARSGAVLIDDVNIARMSLHDLRSRLQIISQVRRTTLYLQCIQENQTISIQPEQNRPKSGGEGVLTGNTTILLGVVESTLSNIVCNVKLALPRLHQ